MKDELKDKSANTLLNNVGDVVMYVMFTIAFSYPLTQAINWIFAPNFLQMVFGTTCLSIGKTYSLMLITGMFALLNSIIRRQY